MLSRGLQGRCSSNACEIGEMEMLSHDEGGPKVLLNFVF